MSVFHHPHRIYGIVQTAMGAFNVSRGLVEAPDDVGETLGWRRVDGDDPPSIGATVTEASVRPAQEFDESLCGLLGTYRAEGQQQVRGLPGRIPRFPKEVERLRDLPPRDPHGDRRERISHLSLLKGCAQGGS